MRIRLFSTYVQVICNPSACSGALHPSTDPARPKQPSSLSPVPVITGRLRVQSLGNWCQSPAPYTTWRCGALRSCPDADGLGPGSHALLSRCRVPARRAPPKTRGYERPHPVAESPTEAVAPRGLVCQGTTGGFDPPHACGPAFPLHAMRRAPLPCRRASCGLF